jgi:(S)-3,5-dihydroxyphenylglycine transaminase
MTVIPTASTGYDIRRDALHASVSDPVLDTVNYLNEVTLRYPAAISFSPGRPYDGFFAVEQIIENIRGYLTHLAELGQSPEQIRAVMFQYGPTSGHIREVIADSLRLDEDIQVAPESIVVTVGAQEAMVLALRTLIASREDVLLVPNPCYMGITGAARLLDIELTTVDEGPDGLCCAGVEAAVRAERARGRSPRALYVSPDHSNPLGSTMSLTARSELLALAGELDLLILEDSPYRLVSPGPQLPTLKSLDRDRRVVHIGSFSKSLFPGARVGFAVADQVVVDRHGGTGLLADEFAKIKSMLTVNTPSLSQAVVAGMLLAAGGGAKKLNARTSVYYGDAMDATLRELERHFPPERRQALGIEWNRPTGGFFLTVDVPFRADEAALARSVRDYGVIWTPMSYFYLGGGGDHVLRLSISYLGGSEIAEGIARLARFIEDEAANSVADGGAGNRPMAP